MPGRAHAAVSLVEANFCEFSLLKDDLEFDEMTKAIEVLKAEEFYAH